MNKFIVFFCIPAATMQEWMTKTDEVTRKEQTDKLMADWQKWSTDNKASIVDGGSPVGKTKRVMASSIEDARNDINYMMVIQADSHDAAAELVKSNPHLQQIPGSYADVSAVSHPGM